MTRAEEEVYAYLDSRGIPYARAEHERVSAISECAVAEKLLGGRMPRNLFLAPRNLSAYYLLVAHPDSPFRTSSVSRQARSSRLSFAPEEALARLLHTHPGAVSPLGLIFDARAEVRLLIDRRLLGEEYWLFHPLENTASVRLSAESFLKTFLPSIPRTPTYVDMD